jgi:hypothetical protein
MKNILVLLFLFSLVSCKSQKATSEISIIYKAITRGNLIEIKATSDLIT